MYAYVFLFLCVVNLGDFRRIYYPDTKDPNAIVFEGPTNYENRNAANFDAKKTHENEIDDDFELDVRYGNAGGAEETSAVIFFPND